MYEFSLNKLAGMLDVDRATLVRALKETPADAGSERKPLFRVSTAVKALDHHQGKPDRRRKSDNGGGSDVALRSLIDEHFASEARMRALPTLAERREAARAMIPSIIKMDKVTREVGIANGHDSDVVHLRADAMRRIYARGIEGPCEWTHDQVWGMLDPETEDA